MLSAIFRNRNCIFITFKEVSDILGVAGVPIESLPKDWSEVEGPDIHSAISRLNGGVLIHGPAPIWAGSKLIDKALDKKSIPYRQIRCPVYEKYIADGMIPDRIDRNEIVCI